MLRRSFLTLFAAAAGLSACSSSPASPPSPAASAPAREFAFDRGGDRPLPTKVWLPAGSGPHPLIYFSHGLTSQPDDYADLLAAWAAAGFLVAGPKYPHTWYEAPDYDADDVVNQPADAQHVITELLTALGDRVDPQRIAAAGHSAGAITTVGLFSGTRDARLRAGLMIAGRQMEQPSPFTGPAAPLLFVQGKKDETVTYEQAYGAYNEVPWPKGFLEIPDGGHLPHRDEPALVAATTTDFWRWTLNGDQAARQRLPQDGLVSTF
ncbi:alpha/beta hydrolase family protein [Actinoplanes subglobosus]|uniref:Alpha/beta hydrolase family protein n=1 Tax=Actinoplanes subglobosus TaxID=1547892 RepID=A0ABV8ITR9_9ACTN